MDSLKNAYKPKPSDFHPHDGYKEEFVKDFFAVSLVTFAYNNFFKVHRIRQFKELEALIESRNITTEELVDFCKKYDCLLNTLLDSILISISFENYFKAKLLLNNFIIHKVENNLKDLSDKQNFEPITVNELTLNTSEKFVGLTLRTLNFNLLLTNENYYKYYNINEDSLNYLREVNKKRNELHLYMSEKPKMGIPEFNKLKKIKEIVECDFALLNNTILDKIDKNSSSRIKVKCNKSSG